jgi:lysophospholipase L1-like esterase
LNEGLGGEETAAGLLRLPMVFARDQMDVLLLDEGANDLLGHGASAIPDVVNNLRAMIRQARNRNIAVFVSTLLPERPEGSRGGAWQLITPTNAQITAMVAAESAVLVDTYTPLAQDVSTFIGDDGLHPTPAGYQRMAEIFFQVLRDRLEIAPSALPGRFSVLRGTAGR